MSTCTRTCTIILSLVMDLLNYPSKTGAQFISGGKGRAPFFSCTPWKGWGQSFSTLEFHSVCRPSQAILVTVVGLAPVLTPVRVAPVPAFNYLPVTVYKQPLVSSAEIPHSEAVNPWVHGGVHKRQGSGPVVCKAIVISRLEGSQK